MKRKLALALAATLMLSTALTGCGSKEDTAKDSGSSEKKETKSKTEVVNEEKAEGDKFTLGFDASFPPYGYMMTMVNMSDLTWTWPRKCVTGMDGSL